MGRVKTGNSTTENSIHHFSHPHPLELITHHQQAKQGLDSSSSLSHSCSACKLQLINGSPIYACKSCNFSLHEDCFKMPREITHHSHKHHVFTLLPKSPYPDGTFECDACGDEGDGFAYHCRICSLDLHIPCVVSPLSLSHASHHHPLHLTFPPTPTPHPYLHQEFLCDICKSQGNGKFWRYRCNSCDFDAHLSCAMSRNTAPQQFTRPNLSQNSTRPIGGPVNLQGIINGGNNNIGAGAGAGQNIELLRALIENYSRIHREQLQQQQQAAAMAGGGGGGLEFLQAFNGGNGGGLNYLDLLSGGGSGGGGAEFLQALNGGNNGGLNYLDLLSGGGGGGGGLDYLQALSGGVGGGGGGGGAELLQALMGCGGGGLSGLSSVLGGDGGTASMINSLAGLFGGLNF